MIDSDFIVIYRDLIVIDSDFIVIDSDYNSDYPLVNVYKTTRGSTIFDGDNSLNGHFP